MKGESPIAIKHPLRAVACAFAFVALALASGCSPDTRVRVVGPDGAPVSGAEVYENNVRIGLTDATGLLELPRELTLASALVARKQVFELPGWRPHHDPERGPEHDGLSWTERVYITSMNVQEDGTLDPLVVREPAAEQTLVLRNDNTLIGLHFMVSVIWDATDADLVEIGEKFRQAGDYIYNATDGQIYFEQVDIVDDNVFWRDAEYHWHADTSVWPNSWSLRGVFVPNGFGSAIEMSRRTDLLGDFKTIAHEFGHLGFGLMDEWMPGDAFCAAHVRETDPLFGRGMPKASCVMFTPWDTSKYCSNQSLNPHTFGSLEAATCWSVIASGFADRTNTPARWTFKTPDTRGAIVGPLPPGSSARWQPRINIDNRVAPGSNSLCEPFAITATWNDGSLGVNWPVTLAVGDRQFYEGPTDGNGWIRIVGAHPGDRLWVGNLGPWRSVVATPSVGPNTCGMS